LGQAATQRRGNSLISPWTARHVHELDMPHGSSIARGNYCGQDDSLLHSEYLSMRTTNGTTKSAVGVKIRLLYGSDFTNGFFDVLSNLAEVNLTPTEAGEILRHRLRNGIQTYVALLDDAVVGTAGLLIEKKFIHRGGLIGHIEDVAVHPAHEGKGIGKALVRHALQEARKAGCYKVILNCKESNIPFYERLGFRRHEIEMRIDF
jgi:glucosamine-phosphate N-acetyltransferase